MAVNQLTESISRNNFYAYLWHAIFLALAQNFMDVDTIVPSMIIDAGGSSFHIGLLTAIMVGGTSFMQLAFSPYLNNKPQKKGYLIFAILMRVSALMGLGIILFFYSQNNQFGSVLAIIFVLITLFSLSGAFAAISYTDILGKSMLEDKRKSFFSLRQALASAGVFISALLAAKMLNTFSYPYNYGTLFMTAGGALAIATLGFWRVKEVRSKIVKLNKMKDYFVTIKREVSTNLRLRGYLLIVNTLGVSLSLLPFLVLYSKEHFSIGNDQVGQYLIFKVSAGVLSGLFIFYLAKRVKYKVMLYAIGSIALLVPIHLLLYGKEWVFIAYFFIGGIIYTFYKVAMEGILLEVSNNENRAIYAGLSGAGNIIPTLFPIAGGWLIGSYGFNVFFTVFGLIILLSFYFIWRLKCQK